jgi:glycosyltransferase involved in cell wall biosynthesis
MNRQRLMLVLEQTLGNAVHGEHLAAAAERDPRVEPLTVRLGIDPSGWQRRVPVLGNWTVEASWRARQAVRAQERRGGVDALFVHTQCPAQLMPDLLRRVPSVVSTDAPPVAFDSVGSAYGHRTRSPRVESLKRRVTGSAFRAASFVTVWSRWAAESMVRDYGVREDRVRVIYPGVDLERFPAPATARGTGPVRLLFVGGDFERKGGPDLLAAFAALGAGFELDIVTRGEVDGLPPGAHLHRGLTHDSPALFDLYNRADIFALPTRADTLGLVYAEALAAGVPVVGCDLAAVREIVVPGETGLLVPPGSPRDLVAALQTLGGDPVLRERMGRRGRQLVEHLHDAERNCRSIVELMLEAIEVPPRRRVRASGQFSSRHRNPLMSPVDQPGACGERRPLMLVSASADQVVRSEAAAGDRPTPEYLLMEQHHNVKLVDWSVLVGDIRGRSPSTVASHLRAALPELRHASAVLTDGEHLGLPLALAMQVKGPRVPHVMITHHLTTTLKRRLLRWTPALRAIDRIVVHSTYQADILVRELGLPSSKVTVIAYGVDTRFWSPQPVPVEPLVVAVGREHRDHRTLALACADLPVQVFISDSSAHSADARRAEPFSWPANVRRGRVSFRELRRLYASAAVVAVPLVPTDFPAGITTVREAMSMGKATVVTATLGLSDLVHSEPSLLSVPPQDVAALRGAIDRVLRDEGDRVRRGEAARQSAVREADAATLAGQLATELELVTTAKGL